MPVILTAKDEVETWLPAGWEDVAKLQRPLPVELLTEVGEVDQE